jgi:hypothetical protein
MPLYISRVIKSIQHKKTPKEKLICKRTYQKLLQKARGLFNDNIY